jgi:hypothetical protein
MIHTIQTTLLHRASQLPGIFGDETLVRYNQRGKPFKAENREMAGSKVNTWLSGS